jgi:hypothetical protein
MNIHFSVEKERQGPTAERDEKMTRAPFDQSPLLSTIQARPDTPFGMLFLGVSVSLLPEPLFGKKVTTQTNEETTNDGKSKLDPLYDEDENDDEEIPEKY